MRRDLSAIRLDGFAWALMAGSVEMVAFSTFALRIGTSEVLTGLLGTVPLVIGALVQLISPWGVAWSGSHRRWTIFTALVQALAFVPLAIGAVRGELPAPVLFGAVALYWGAGFAAGASWTALVGVLVPRSIRATYFAHRTRLNHLGIFLGLAVTGLILHWAYAGPRPAGSGPPREPMWAFVGIFAGAALCRVVSAWQLARYSEPPSGTLAAARPESVRPGEMLGRLKRSPARGLLTVMFALMVTSFIASPFYVPFMLKRLQLSYLEFMVLVGVVPLAKVAALPLLGRLAQRYGARRLMWIAVIGVAPPAGAWVVSDHFVWLVVIQAASGAAWAAYELATFLLLLESVPEDERTGVMTSWNLVNALGQTAGSFIGGSILSALAHAQDGAGPPTSAYFVVFVLSACLRLGCVALLPRLGRGKG